MDAFGAVLDYIRKFFGAPLPRKRRGSEIENCVSPKNRRYMPYHRNRNSTRDLNDDWFARASSTYRKPLENTRRLKTKPQVIDTIILNDDDDDVVEIKKPKEFTVHGRPLISRFTSTPTDAGRKAFVTTNGIDSSSDDDVAFVKETKSPNCKKEEAKLAGFNYIKPYSGKFIGDRILSTGTTDMQNGFKPKSASKRNLSRTSTNSFKNNSRLSNKSDILETTYRMDDKMQYKKLLEAAANSTFDSSIYQTPIGKLFEYDTANQRNKSSSKSPLSEVNKSQEKPKESTREFISRILDNQSSEPVSVKDSDSDDVVFVNPPSPKPDIKVDPVNSFKKIVDVSKATKRGWLDELVERHKRTVEERQKEIDNLRDSSQKHGDINRDINLELLRRKVDVCLKIKETVIPVEEKTVLPPLSDEQLLLVSKIFKGDPNEVLVRKFNLNITRRDLMTLAGLNWLNDEVINFYMNLIMERGKKIKWPNSYAFNTFFYPKLLKDGPRSLRRWTKKIDIFSYDIVCVPVHLGMHWCMAIIDFRDKSIRYYDSMGSSNDKCLRALRNYLEEEHMDKKKSRYNTDDFILENMDDIPQQMNGSDCGMFSCTFAEFVTRNAKITFKQDDMPYLRNKMAVEIVTGELLIQ